MTIPEIVEKYTIRANPNKNLCVRREILKHEDDKAYIKEHRDEIIAYIEEQKAIEEQKHLERLKKMNAIEGLQELEDASIAWKEYSTFTKGLRFRQTKHNMSYGRYDKIVYVR